MATFGQGPRTPSKREVSCGTSLHVWMFNTSLCVMGLNSPQYLHSSLRGSSRLMVETSFVLHMSVSAFLCFTIADSPECHHQAWLGEHKPAGRGLSCVHVLFTCLCFTGSDNSGYYSVSQAQTAQGTALFHRPRQLRVLMFHRFRQLRALLCFTGSDSLGYCSVSQVQTAHGTALFHRFRQLRALLCFTGSDSSGHCSVSQAQTAQGTAVSQAQTAQGTITSTTLGMVRGSTRLLEENLAVLFAVIFTCLSHRLRQFRGLSPRIVRRTRRLLEENSGVMYLIFICICCAGSDSPEHHLQA